MYDKNSNKTNKEKTDLNDASILLDMINFQRVKKDNKIANIIIKSDINEKKLNCSNFDRNYVLNNNKLWKKHSHNLNCAIEVGHLDKNGNFNIKKNDIIQDKKIVRVKKEKTSIIEDLKNGLRKIEKNLKDTSKLNSIQREIEKIEIRHMEGRLEDFNYKNEIENATGTSSKFNPHKKVESFNQWKERKTKILKNEKSKQSIIDINSSGVIQNLNNLLGKKSRKNENKGSLMLNNILEINTNKNDSFSDSVKSKNTNSLDESEIKKLAEFDLSELDIINDFILEEEISKDSNLKKIFSNLDAYEKKLSGKKNNILAVVEMDKKSQKILESQRTKHFLNSLVYDNSVQKGTMLDHISVTRLNCINFVSERLKKIMRIIYPDMMSKKQQIINLEIRKMKEINKLKEEIQKLKNLLGKNKKKKRFNSVKRLDNSSIQNNNSSFISKNDINDEIITINEQSIEFLSKKNIDNLNVKGKVDIMDIKNKNSHEKNNSINFDNNIINEKAFNTSKSLFHKKNKELDHLKSTLRNFRINGNNDKSMNSIVSASNNSISVSDSKIKSNQNLLDLNNAFSNNKTKNINEIKKGFNMINDKLLDLRSIESINSIPNFLRKLNDIESFFIKAKKMDDIIYNEKYFRNKSVHQKLREKLIY